MHKTVRVHATRETDLYMDINVPIGMKDDDICQILDDGILDDTPLSDWKRNPRWGSYDWRWQEHDYDTTFNPNAPDFTEEMLTAQDILNTWRTKNENISSL
jgi:hypothetical protein